MRIVIEIDENQSGTAQSSPVAATISTESTASSSSTTTAASSVKGTDAGAGPAGGLTQMDSTMPFIQMPSAAAAAAAETSMNASSAGAAPGESQETYSTESSTET